MTTTVPFGRMDSGRIRPDRSAYLAALHRDGLAFGSLAAGHDLALPVPSCAGWTLADLVAHLAEVYHFWGEVVSARVGDPDDVTPLARPADHELVGTYWSAFQQLQTAVSIAEPSERVWTWRGDRGPDTVLRRMVHETAVHLWDATGAVGQARPLDAEMASDGIDEFLAVFQSVEAGDDDPSVHLHCTDTDGEWTVRPSGGVLTVSHEHAKGEVAMRGPASALLLVLWRRLPVTGVELFGDPARAELFVSRYQVG